MDEGLVLMWLISVTGVAICALYDVRRHMYSTARYFMWLAVLSVMVFGFAFGIAG